MSGRRGHSLGDDDQTLWSTFTKSITPLEKRKRIAAAKSLDQQRAAPPPVVRAERPKAPPVKAAKPASPPPPPLAPLDRRAKKRVASGRNSIDGKIDLHGMTQAEAHDALGHFIHRAVARGWRIVLVITGKGRGGAVGVLRQQVPHWLSLPDVRSQIFGFEPAHVTHGGEGALYVRLRRQRP
jgi:DNA-nicking Smr family endonuclease